MKKSIVLMMGLVLVNQAWAFPKVKAPRPSAAQSGARQAAALSCADFTGSYVGKCTDSKGGVTDNNTVISQDGCEGITSDGDYYVIGGMSTSVSSNMGDGGIAAIQANSVSVDWSADRSELVINDIDLLKLPTVEPVTLPVRATAVLAGSQLTVNYVFSGQTLLNCVYNRQ